jgi:hypothetical protein
MESRSSDMRVAVISDIHGNLTAFEAVVADLRQSSPDVILEEAIWLTQNRVQ